MANQEQVELLKQGDKAWNNWREKNPETKIDLAGARLEGFDLEGFDLEGADLEGADLEGASLTDVCLTGAKARGTNFCNANLHCARLNGAEFKNALFINAELNCADLCGADLCDANLSNADLKNAYFNDSELRCADLSDADLRCANLNGANLNGANLRRVKLRDASLANASLILAELNGIELHRANIEGTTLDYAIVDGRTLIVDCKINDSTYAHGVGLDSARIEESLKTKLKKNIRKKYWEDRYLYCFDRRSIPRYIRSIPQYLRLLLTPKRWSSILKVLWSCIVREFWMASDYGSSTRQILKTFGCWSLLFSVLYLITAPAPDGAFWPTPLGNPFLDNFGTANIFEQNLCNNFPGSFFCYFQLWFRSLYFSVVTMTTLGFGDIHAHPLSVPGQALVMLQVLIGYVLLGVLITRLSILFQDVG